MSLSFPDAAKARKLREFFTRHGRIYIVVDATDAAVHVPEHLKGDPALRLVLNQRMPQPIYIRDDALDSELSFGGQVYACHIPMKSIWAAYLPEGDMEHGLVWDDAVPEMIRSVVKAVRGMQSGEAGAPAEGAEEEAVDSDSAQPKGRKVRHLRVIK